VSHGAFSYEGLDRVLHERARLSILTALSTAPEATPDRPGGRLFADLRSLCDLTDGNLSRHLKVLDEAGLLVLRKRNSGRNAETWVRLSAPGRRSFLRYLEELERVLRDARASQVQGTPGLEPGHGPAPA